MVSGSTSSYRPQAVLLEENPVATTTPNRILPSWNVSEELAEEMVTVREVPGLYFRPDERFTARLVELISSEQPSRTRVTLGSFLDDEQLSAVLAGETFSIEGKRLRPCIFPTGRIVHLQAEPLYSGRHADESGFAYYPVCQTNGSFPDPFDDEHYTRLATTQRLGRHEIPTGRTLPSEEVLESVCDRCVAIAHRTALEAR